MPSLAAGVLFLLLQQEDPVKLKLDADRPVLLRGIPFTLTITADDDDFSGEVTLTGLFRRDKSRKEQRLTRVKLVDGKAVLTGVVARETVTASHKKTKATLDRPFIPPWLCILPPLLAVLLAFITREVLASLFAGVWLGMLIILGFGPWELIRACLAVVDTAVMGTLDNPHHVNILGFIILLGGMVSLLTSSGGTKGLADVLARNLHSRRAGMLATWFMGIIVFIDDYASCLLVGNTMRPLADRRRISREKLSYIVNSTAAPIATIGVFSTALVFQLDLMTAEHLFVKNEAFSEFLNIIPYTFYALFSIFFVFLVSATGRDFGPMYRVEERTIKTAEVQRMYARPMIDRDVSNVRDVEDLSSRWPNAVIPIVGFLFFSVLALYLAGLKNDSRADFEDEFWYVIGHSDSARMILWGVIGGPILAFLVPILRRHLKMKQALEAWFRGTRGIFIAVLVLMLAWSMAKVCADLSTGAWLAENAGEHVSIKWLPAVVFLVSALIAFSIGSAWTTMAIMIPVVVGFLTGSSESGVLYATLAAVLSGGVFGVHVSPIADRTIMASIGAAADHIDHVRTQAPYSIVCALVALGCGFVPIGFGVPVIACVAAGLVVLTILLFVFGKKHEAVFAE